MSTYFSAWRAAAMLTLFISLGGCGDGVDFDDTGTDSNTETSSGNNDSSNNVADDNTDNQQSPDQSTDDNTEDQDTTAPGTDGNNTDNTVDTGLADDEVMFRVSQVPENTPDGDTVFMVGSFNGWDPCDPNFEMTANGDGQFEVVLNFAGQTDLIQYKFTRGNCDWENVEKDETGAEIDNRTFSYEGQTAVVEHQIAAWADFSAPVELESTRVGNIEVIENFSMLPHFDRERTIWVYLPPDYETASNKSYPVLYMNDGQNLFDQASAAFGTEWQVDETLEQLFADGQTDGVIVVGINNGGAHRRSEYSAWNLTRGDETIQGEGEAYANFLITTLKPWVDSNYRTLPGPTNTGIAGSSTGALNALYVALANQNVFGKAGVISLAALEKWYGNQVSDFVENTPVSGDLRVYLDIGDMEIVDNENQALIDATNTIDSHLSSKPFVNGNYRYQVIEGAEHSEAAWAARFSEIFLWMFE